MRQRQADCRAVMERIHRRQSLRAARRPLDSSLSLRMARVLRAVADRLEATATQAS